MTLEKKDHPKALLITVNYKSESSTLELLASLDRLRGFSDIDVIVVDNCSGEAVPIFERNLVGQSRNSRDKNDQRDKAGKLAHTSLHSGLRN